MIKLIDGATFGTGRMNTTSRTALVVDATSGSPVISVETDPTEFLNVKTFSDTGSYEITLIKDLKYKVALNGGEVWITDAHILYS